MDKYPFFGTIIVAMACRDGVVLCSDCKSSHDPQRTGQLPELPDVQKIGPVGKMVGTPKKHLAVAGAAGFGGIYSGGEYVTTLDRVEDILCEVEPKRMNAAVVDLGVTIAEEIGRAFIGSPTQPRPGQRLLQVPIVWTHDGQLRMRHIQIVPEDGQLKIDNREISQGWFEYAAPLVFGADKAIAMLAKRSADPRFAPYYEDARLEPFLIGGGAPPGSYRRSAETGLDEARHVVLSLVQISAELYAEWGHPDLLGTSVNLALLHPRKGFRWLK